MILLFPGNVTVSDINYHKPLIMMPGNIKSSNLNIIWWFGRTIVLTTFNSSDIVAGVGQSGPVEVLVTGQLFYGRFFQGIHVINIHE